MSGQQLKDGTLKCFVKTRRKELSLTQTALAERLGTTQTALSRIESGRATTIIIALKIAAALDTHVEHLWSCRRQEWRIPEQKSGHAP